MWESFENYLNKKMKRLLPLPFRYWKSYMMGLIDENGKLLRKPSTANELQIHNAFTDLVRKFKRTMELYIPSKGVLRHKVYKDFLDDNSIINKIAETMNYSYELDVINEEQIAIIENELIWWLNSRGNNVKI